MTTDLDNLRKVAEAATPGPWEMREGNPQMGGRNFTLRVQGKAGIRMSAHCYGFNGDPEFIATFDPPTILALLSRLEQAESALSNQTSTVKTLAERNIELTEQKRVMNVRFDAMRAGRDSERSRADKNANKLEQAEQAVRRVRELAVYLKKLAPGDKHYAEMIDRALDGDTRG